MIITRFHDIEKMDITVEFLTPTFLGGADQQGELRSPPFKNLLRQWWRVVNGNLATEELRSREGIIFGSVSDSGSSASKVLLTVSYGQTFQLSSDPIDFGSTPHPKVKGNKPVRNASYLGFGPIPFSKSGQKVRRYITPGSQIILSLAFPRQYNDEIIQTLQYIDSFATIGCRSRNGFGSLCLSSDRITKLDPSNILMQPFHAIIENNKEYPNGFGCDNKNLLAWDSIPFSRWDQAMQVLAGTYLKARVSIKLSKHGLQPRHALGYPVKDHTVAEWEDKNGSGRMPSQLRLMVKRDQQNRLVARILHLPHKLPKQWPGNLPSELDVWRQVHLFLDNQRDFHRIGGNA